MILELALTVLALAALGHSFAADLRAQRIDRRRMLADGGAADATVESISAPDTSGDRLVTLRFAVGKRPQRAGQQATSAAITALGLAPGMAIAVRHRLDRPRLAFAPALVLAAHAPAPTLAPGDGDGPMLYLVSFEDPDSPASFQARNGQGWTAGELVVDAANLRLHAIRPRLWGKPTPASRTFPLAWIQNADANGCLVTFEIVVGGAPNLIRLWVADAASAADLVRRLPAIRTDTFVPARAETAEFHRRLVAAVPTTPVTTALILVNALAFVVTAALGAGWLVAEGDRLVAFGSNYTTLTQGGQWWRLLTNAFLHFGAVHLAINLVAIGVNGPFAERLYGSTRYLLIYVAAAIGASLATLWWYPLANSAGASGAIFGVFGATLAFFMRAPDGMPSAVAERHRNWILLFIALSFVLGLRIPFVDHAAHLGGLLAGFGVGFALARPVGAPRTDPARERQHALGVAVAAGAVVAVMMLGGPTTEAISATVAGGVPGVVPHPTLTALAGIRLGATRADLDATRGPPLRDGRNTRVYDVGAPGHPALLEVTLRAAGATGAPGDTVGAIFYRGDKAYAPPELLYVTGQPRGRFVADFGQPAWLLHAKDGVVYEMYADGLTIELEHDRARAYGVQDYYRTLHD
jgi:membrane associated rhomboid family serine protease